nr:uncharacterized protein LOC111420983 [Onthophagus taurus]XP_022909854.1 uncharacterized protein LOC111420983 [Onthophagus taurus]XP_022909855.1 uncharacterized protein LOC111420983 [Onthophagus taurus]
MGNIVYFNFILFAIIFQITSATNQSDFTNSTSTENISTKFISRKILNLFNWVKDQSQHEETFIGRCLGIGKKLRFAMPLVIFLLGVIITTMKFLTLFTLKGVGIGLAILMLNVGGLFAKLGALFKQNNHQQEYKQPQNVHFHIHNKEDGQYHVDHSTTGWADRVSEGLSKTNNFAEKMELINLYKRLGFNVDNLPALRY